VEASEGTPSLLESTIPSVLLGWTSARAQDLVLDDPTQAGKQRTVFGTLDTAPQEGNTTPENQIAYFKVLCWYWCGQHSADCAVHRWLPQGAQVGGPWGNGMDTSQVPLAHGCAVLFAD